MWRVKIYTESEIYIQILNVFITYFTFLFSFEVTFY